MLTEYPPNFSFLQFFSRQPLSLYDYSVYLLTFSVLYLVTIGCHLGWYRYWSGVVVLGSIFFGYFLTSPVPAFVCFLYFVTIYSSIFYVLRG